MPAKDLKIEDLLLDVENPRISRAGGQKDALQKIIEDQDIKLVSLAESIVDDGGLNPMDRLLVIKSPDIKDKYLVLEGNRRLAAIKILHNPAVLTGLEVRAAIQKKFEELAAGFDRATVEPIDCYEVSGRVEGATWIHQRHTGENDGRGIVNWSSVASRRFTGRDPALQALDFVTTHGGLADEEKKSIENRFPITTLDRLLSTPAVRAKLGLEIEDQKLLTKLPADEIMKSLRRIVRDLASKAVVVTELKKVGQQVEYVSNLKQELPDLSKASKKAKVVDTFGVQDFKQPVPPKAKPKAKRPKRKSLIPKECRLNVSNAKIDEIFKELRSLPLADYPHAISVLFRVFLETSVDEYMTRSGMALVVKTGGGDKDKSLRKKVEEATTHLINDGTPKKHLAGILKAVSQKDNPLNVDTLNGYVHNRFFSPTERDLRVAWDNAQPFFEKMWP
jgi:hypothetical protein